MIWQGLRLNSKSPDRSAAASTAASHSAQPSHRAQPSHSTAIAQRIAIAQHSHRTAQQSHSKAHTPFPCPPKTVGEAHA